MKISKTSFAAGAITAFALTGAGFAAGTLLDDPVDAALTGFAQEETTSPSASASGTPTQTPVTSPATGTKVDSSTIARTTMKTASFDKVAQGEDLDGDDVIDLLWAEAKCPSGTVMTGGGIIDKTATGVAMTNGPGADNSWFVSLYVDGRFDKPEDMSATVTCLNPTGAVTGSQRKRDSQTLHLDARDAVAQRMRAN